jgi:hypothetical protein
LIFSQPGKSVYRKYTGTHPYLINMSQSNSEQCDFSCFRNSERVENKVTENMQYSFEKILK